MSGSSVRAGRAYIELGLRNRIAEGAKAVERDLRNIGQSALQIGGAIGGLGLALSAPIIKGVMAFATFDDAMRAVKGVTQATDADFKAMTATAKELGRTTSFTAVEVASLMTELGRAGFKPDQINEMTGAVLNLARATGTDATLSAGIMSATIRQFGLEASDAARVSDVLTAAANNSFNSVGSLGEALKYAGPIAADLGMSLEETVAILGTLGNVGIQGSEAGTALRRLSIIGAAEVAKLEEIFGTGLRNAAGEGLPLVEMLGKIATATNGMDNGTRARKMAEAFGLLGITGASAISKTTTETGELLKILEAAGGVAKKTAEEMDSGIGGSFRILMSAIEGADIAIGEAFESEIQTAVEAITGAIGVTTQWMESNKELVLSAGLVAGGMVGLGAAAVAVGIAAYAGAAAISASTTAATVAAGIYGGFTAVMGMVNAAVLATSAGIAFMGSSSTAAAAGAALLNGAYAASPVVAGLVVSSFGVVGAVLTALTAPVATATALAGFLSTAWASSAAVMSSAWAVALGPLLPLIAAGAAVVALVGAAAGVAAYQTFDLGEAWTKVREVIGGAISLVSEVGSVMKSALSTGDYATAANALWLGLQVAFWEGAAGVKDAFVWMVGKSWEFIKNFFSNMLSMAWETMKAVATAIMNPLSAVQTISNAIANIASAGTSIDFSTNADAARKQLADLRAAQQATANLLEADELKSDPVKEAAKKDLAKIDRLEKAGALTSEEAETQRSKVKARIEDEPTFGGDDSKDAFDEKIKALEYEIIALENGADAAERKKLKDDGLNVTQIEAIELLKQKKKAIEEAKAAEQDAASKRVDQIFKVAGELEKKGLGAGDIFQRTMKQIDADEASGKIGSDVANDARERARSDAAGRQDALKEEGRRLMEAMRTPQEKMNAELANLARLQDAGVIDEKTALRKEDAIRAEFDEQNKKKVDDTFATVEEKAANPAFTAVSSGFAAGLLNGFGGAITKEEKLLEKIAASNERIAKKDNQPRWA
jgi:TP901 family phage tail tape measure protein